MAYYEPLKGIQGIQTDFNKFQFSWESAGNDYQAHFLWIYKEDEPVPQMWKYSKCIDNRVQVTFQYNNVPLQEIRKIKFLVFLSDDQREPSRNDIQIMSQRKDFLCEVCCGTGEIGWKWIADQKGMRLMIRSEKKIPEGILYYEYPYGNKMFRFDIPGEINLGDNYYGYVYFPEIPGLPQLQSRVQNLRISAVNGKNTGKTQDNTNNGGFFKKFADMIRH